MSFATTNKRQGASHNTGRRRTMLLAAAATASTLAGIATNASAQNLVTWTGAVNITWDAQTTSFTGTLNWTSGGSPTFYSHRDNAVFTDNFAGVGTLNMVAIDVGTISASGGEPNSV